MWPKPIQRPATRFDDQIGRVRDRLENSRAETYLGPVWRFFVSYSEHTYHVFLWTNIAVLWGLAGLTAITMLGEHGTGDANVQAMALFFRVVGYMIYGAVFVGVFVPGYWALRDRYDAWKAAGGSA